MSALTVSLQKYYSRDDTDVSLDEEPLYVERLPVFNPGESTLAIDEPFELKEFPSMIISEQKFDIATTRESLVFQVLTNIHEIAKGRLTTWQEDEHLGEKFLFEIAKRKPRI